MGGPLSPIDSSSPSPPIILRLAFKPSTDGLINVTVAGPPPFDQTLDSWMMAVLLFTSLSVPTSSSFSEDESRGQLWYIVMAGSGYTFSTLYVIRIFFSSLILFDVNSIFSGGASNTQSCQSKKNGTNETFHDYFWRNFRRWYPISRKYLK